MRTRLLSGSALAWLAVAAPCQEPPGKKKVAVGELVPDPLFRGITGGDGRTKVSELRGQPVLIVNWTDSDFGRGAADRIAKVGEQMIPRGLVVILHDSHNKAQDAIEASVMRMYPGNEAWLIRTHNLPFDYADNGPPPDIALIGVDGRVLLAGSYTADFSKAMKMAEAEFDRCKEGWGEHEAVQRVRAAMFGQKRLGAAKALLDEALAATPDHTELLEAQKELLAKRASWARSVTFLREQGQPERALAAARAFAESVIGDEDWAGEAKALLEAFATEEGTAELEAERKLASLLKPLEKRKPTKADADKLAGFATNCGPTTVKARARRLADIAALAAK